MELVLNLGWALLAVCMLVLWLRISPRSDSDRRVQLVALALAIIILLPAISMTDDLLAARNPAEIDTYLRRDHDWSMAHAVFPVAIALVVPIFASLSFKAHLGRAQGRTPAPQPSNPALSSIDTRPPPVA